jgi:shikimate kinase
MRQHASIPRGTPPSIVVMGLRCSGKTTCGRRVAELLNLPFIDLDDRTRGTFGNLSAVEIWARHGQQAWRDAEARALARVCDEQSRCVLALGGGTPCVPDARRLLERARRDDRAICIYLRTDAAILASRLRDQAADRPSVTGKPAHEEVADLLALREPVFRSLADAEVDAGAATPDEIAHQLVELVRARLA